MEIERKWLVDKEKITPLLDHGFKVEQHYLNDIEDDWLIRVRDEGCGYYVLTLKGKGLMARPELEFEITEKEYRDSLEYSKSCVLKTRFFIDLFPEDVNCERWYEIDVFDDHDFIICELEFNTVEEAGEFNPPDWCLKEVTCDSTYQNINLARPNEN